MHNNRESLLNLHAECFFLVRAISMCQTLIAVNTLGASIFMFM